MIKPVGRFGVDSVARVEDPAPAPRGGTHDPSPDDFDTRPGNAIPLSSSKVEQLAKEFQNLGLLRDLPLSFERMLSFFQSPYGQKLIQEKGLESELQQVALNLRAIGGPVPPMRQAFEKWYYAETETSPQIGWGDHRPETLVEFTKNMTAANPELSLEELIQYFESPLGQKTVKAHGYGAELEAFKKDPNNIGNDSPVPALRQAFQKLHGYERSVQKMFENHMVKFFGKQELTDADILDYFQQTGDPQLALARLMKKTSKSEG